MDALDKSDFNKLSFDDSQWFNNIHMDFISQLKYSYYQIFVIN